MKHRLCITLVALLAGVTLQAQKHTDQQPDTAPQARPSVTVVVEKTVVTDTITWGDGEDRTPAPGTQTWATRTAQRLDSLCETYPLLQTTQVALYVRDLTTGEDVYTRGHRQRMRPASCQKVITAVAALEFMGPDSLVAYNDSIPLGWGWCWDDDWDPHRVVRVDTCRLADFIRPMMKNSDNQRAEALFRIMGKDRKAVARRMDDFFRQRLGFSGGNATCQVADGSGLSLYNYVTPQLMVKVLDYAWRNERMRDAFLNSLPIAAVDGTLSKRMKGTPADGIVRAKTGTVDAVSSLSGYATNAEGHTLAFSIINQGQARAAEAKAFQDRVCRLICQ